jgi:hypothetical protein
MGSNIKMTYAHMHVQVSHYNIVKAKQVVSFDKHVNNG